MPPKKESQNKTSKRNKEAIKSAISKRKKEVIKRPISKRKRKKEVIKRAISSICCGKKHATAIFSEVGCSRSMINNMYIRTITPKLDKLIYILKEYLDSNVRENDYSHDTLEKELRPIFETNIKLKEEVKKDILRLQVIFKILQSQRGNKDFNELFTIFDKCSKSRCINSAKSITEKTEKKSDTLAKIISEIKNGYDKYISTEIEKHIKATLHLLTSVNTENINIQNMLQKTCKELENLKKPDYIVSCYESFKPPIINHNTGTGKSSIYTHDKVVIKRAISSICCGEDHAPAMVREIGFYQKSINNMYIKTITPKLDKLIYILKEYLDSNNVRENDYSHDTIKKELGPILETNIKLKKEIQYDILRLQVIFKIFKSHRENKDFGELFKNFDQCYRIRTNNPIYVAASDIISKIKYKYISKKKKEDIIRELNCFNFTKKHKINIKNILNETFKELENLKKPDYIVSCYESFKPPIINHNTGNPSTSSTFVESNTESKSTPNSKNLIHKRINTPDIFNPIKRMIGKISYYKYSSALEKINGNEVMYYICISTIAPKLDLLIMTICNNIKKQSKKNNIEIDKIDKIRFYINETLANELKNNKDLMEEIKQDILRVHAILQIFKLNRGNKKFKQLFEEFDKILKNKCNQNSHKKENMKVNVLKIIQQLLKNNFNPETTVKVNINKIPEILKIKIILDEALLNIGKNDDSHYASFNLDTIKQNIKSNLANYSTISERSPDVTMQNQEHQQTTQLMHNSSLSGESSKIQYSEQTNMEDDGCNQTVVESSSDDAPTLLELFESNDNDEDIDNFLLNRTNMSNNTKMSLCYSEHLNPHSTEHRKM